MRLHAVTGAASGIGAAVSRALRAEGHRVIGIDIRDADIVADLSTPEGRAGAIERVREASGDRLDGLVLCAGLGAHVEPLRLILEVNYAGAVALLDGLLPVLSRGEAAAAVLVSSVASTQLSWDRNPVGVLLEAGDMAQAEAACMAAGARGGHLAYAGSKNAATVALRRRVSAWAQAGVRLNAIAPGAVETPLLQAGLADPRYGKAIENFVAPMPRRARPEEIAASVLFLLGPQAAYVHGAQLVVDGGIDALARPTQF
jgi:NAD(P)-dependent dehydrogenase (short-subunit alcohol dehydrogenase family)